MDSFEEKKKRVAGFRPIDDGFFEALMKNARVCEEILRVILEAPDLIVEKVVPQYSVKNLFGRSVRLDAYCILGNSLHCNNVPNV